MRKNKKILLITMFTIALIIIPSLLDNQRNVKYPIDNKNTNENKNVIDYLSTSGLHTHEWNRTWGGSIGDEGFGVAVDSSDNVYLTGYTYSFGAGSRDMVLVKYDGMGVQQWNRTWGGIDSDSGIGVAVDSSDNVYVAGNTYSFGAGSSDMVLVKYDGIGVQQWNRTWGGIDSEIGFAVAVDSSDNVYVAGNTNGFGAGSIDMVLVKFDGLGVQQWNRTWGGGSYDYNTGVTVDLSDNVYVTGFTESFGAGSSDIVLVKYNENGVQQWNCTWGGANQEEGYEATVDSSGNVYISGHTKSFGAGGWDMVLVKYDGLGVQQWNRTWGGGSHDTGNGVSADSADSIYIMGSTDNFGAGSSDMVLVKYDGLGAQQWNRTWGGTDIDTGFGVAVDSYDNVYLSGFTDSFGAGGWDMVLVKFSIIPRINIITPENITYIAPMSGYYPATYGFENDKSEEQAHGWTTENEVNTDSEIIDSYKGHNKVYELSDNNDHDKADVLNNFGNQTYGTIELWFLHYSIDYWGHLGISFREPYVSIIAMMIVPGDYLRVFNGTTEIDITEFGIINADEWYHLRVDFRVAGAPPYMGLSEDSFMLHLNGINANDELKFRNTGYPINDLDFSTGWSAAGPDHLVYLDAVGYSWDPNYNIGDNLYEGLLLSYETNIDLDWWGYSLDSQNNVTILGNVTIPMPEDGPHTIQVFGNNSFWNKIQSEIRRFTIDTKLPEIMIHSPIPDDFYGMVPPKYNISIIEANLASTWYTLDVGMTNITFSGLTGTINQTEWDKKGNGMVTIRFYANDTIGRLGYAEVSIFKDMINPSIIDYPTNFRVETGYTGVTISWTATDTNPNTYTIELQGSGIVAGPTVWSSSVAIIYNVPDGLVVGDYIYMVNITDQYGNSVIHTVTLTVRAVSTDGDAIPLELIIIISSTIGGGIVIAVAIVALTRRRRELT